MYFVYRFLDNNDNVIYIGKSKQDLQKRFSGHTHLPDKCYHMVKKIEYIECPTESDMSIKEIYYINKFRHNPVNFNVLDVAELPTTISFDDEWKMYTGPLPSNFSNSINYLSGFEKTTKVRYNSDGSIDQRKANKKAGTSSYVEGLTAHEVNLMIDYFIEKINEAQTPTQQQISFRNLLMFVISVNLPIKPNEFLSLQYKDLFDEHDSPKPYELTLDRHHKDAKIQIPLKEVVKETLLAYTKYIGLSYSKNKLDILFQSRKHQAVTLISWGRILQDAAKASGISKNIGAESTRKTFGLNIYHRSLDKFNALLFLGELWGQSREANIIRYLNLTNDEIDFDYYLGEDFSLCDVDFSKIRCLHQQKSPHEENGNSIALDTHCEQANTKDKCIESHRPPLVPATSSKKETQKTPVSNHTYSKEQKLEVVNTYLYGESTVKEVAAKFGLNASIVSKWVNSYKKYGEDGLEEVKKLKAKHKNTQ